MNRLTKIAIWLGLVGLGLLLLVIASGVAHPNPLFNYGSVIGLLPVSYTHLLPALKGRRCKEVSQKNEFSLVLNILVLYGAADGRCAYS